MMAHLATYDLRYRDCYRYVSITKAVHGETMDDLMKKLAEAYVSITDPDDDYPDYEDATLSGLRIWTGGEPMDFKSIREIDDLLAKNAERRVLEAERERLVAKEEAEAFQKSMEEREMEIYLRVKARLEGGE